MNKLYGCIGERLTHSFSKEIHNALGDYDYRIIELEREALGDFARQGSFAAINVTIPYKEAIIPYLYGIDEHAASIGAVNTVVNRNGKLYGYNTDFFGMSELFDHAGVSVKGKKVLILGTGGTSKTAYAVAAARGAREILRVSRTAREGAITYTEMYARHADAEVVINTTPVGMHPNIFDKAIELERFPCLSGVIDAVYNPLRTPIILDAKERGIPAEGGLYMLVAQAVRASEIFTDTKYGYGELERVYRKIMSDKENIVLIGMPGCGKSTVGSLVSQMLGRELVDTDRLIEKKAGKDIPTIFREDGEAVFRKLEAELIRECASKNGVVIATGGGSVLLADSLDALRENGRIYFIDRPLERLVPTNDRPLSSTSEDITRRYEERYGIYTSVADVAVNADCSPNAVAEKIIKEFMK